MTDSPLAKWALPIESQDVDVAFPASALDWMPSEEEATAGLAELPDKGKSWLDFQRRWFSEGLPEGVSFTLMPGVDGETAMRQLQAIQGSFAPRHQHKQAAVAYLASRWFASVDYGDA